MKTVYTVIKLKIPIWEKKLKAKFSDEGRCKYLIKGINVTKLMKYLNTKN